MSLLTELIKNAHDISFLFNDGFVIVSVHKHKFFYHRRIYFEELTDDKISTILEEAYQHINSSIQTNANS